MRKLFGMSAAAAAFALFIVTAPAHAAPVCDPHAGDAYYQEECSDCLAGAQGACAKLGAPTAVNPPPMHSVPTTNNCSPLLNGLPNDCQGH